jgi:uncharacterized protein YecE (DUF72 family)
LIDAGWYPRDATTAEKRLRYYATQFSVVENDSTYYALPGPRQGQTWVDRTPADFTMNVKAFALLTGHYTDPKRLPRDLREALPAELREKRHLYPKDVGDDMLHEIAARFREGLEPLRAAGRLGVVLFQYPVWWPCSKENQERVSRVGELVPGCSVAVELRNSTWMNERHAERTLAQLREAGLAYTCVDEPQGFPSSVPPIAAATSDTALVRFHGRDATRWTGASTSARDRFTYLYKEHELREWVPKLQRLADEAATVHVIMNNCFSNYAVVNARQMSELLRSSADARRAS